MSTMYRDDELFTSEGFLPYLERVSEILAPLNPEPLDSWQGKEMAPISETFSFPMMSGSIRVFRTEKLQKILIWNMYIMDSIYAVNVGCYPANEYDFPVLLSERNVYGDTGIVHFHSDFAPLTDLSLNPDYMQKYYGALDEPYKACRVVSGVKAHEYPFFGALCSPYIICGKVEKEHQQTILDNQLAYLKAYVDMVQKAEPQEDHEKHTYAYLKKETIPRTVVSNSPDMQAMERMIGKERVELVFHAFQAFDLFDKKPVLPYGKGQENV